MKRSAAYVFFALAMLAAAPACASSAESIQEKLDQLGARGSGQTKAGLYSDLGEALYKNGRMEEAAAAFETALTYDTSRAQRRFIYLFLGKSYESSSRLDKAVSAFENAVLYDRRNWRRHRDLGWLYEQADLPWKARDRYARALELNPSEPALFLSIGRIWRKIGLYSYALPWLEKALAAKEEVEATQLELSLAYEGQGRFDKAAAACAQTADDGKRLVYLAALAGDANLIKDGQARMLKFGASRRTRQDYENLVEWLSHPRPPDDAATPFF